MCCKQTVRNRSSVYLTNEQKKKYGSLRRYQVLRTFFNNRAVTRGAQLEFSYFQKQLIKDGSWRRRNCFCRIAATVWAIWILSRMVERNSQEPDHMQEGVGRNGWEEQGRARAPVECSPSFRVSYMCTAFLVFLFLYVYILST